MPLEFEWDEQKARANWQKHGVSFEEATEVFGDDYAVCVADPDHSIAGARYLLFGIAQRGRHLVVSYTERAAIIRIISARLMTRRERRAYEQ